LISTPILASEIQPTGPTSTIGRGNIFDIAEDPPETVLQTNLTNLVTCGLLVEVVWSFMMAAGQPTHTRRFLRREVLFFFSRHQRPIGITTLQARRISACTIDLARALEELLKEMIMELQTPLDFQMGLMPSHAPFLNGVGSADRCVPENNLGDDYFQYFTGKSGLILILTARQATSWKQPSRRLCFPGYSSGKRE
jgi:hypothetical protein